MSVPSSSHAPKKPDHPSLPHYSSHTADRLPCPPPRAGTSLIAGPPAVVNPIIAQINVTEDCSNLGSLPDISFTMALANNQTHDFVLTPTDYTVRIPGGGPTGGDLCTCGLFAFDAGEGLLPLWILGDPFIRTYFTVFDRGNNLLSFAPSKVAA